MKKLIQIVADSPRNYPVVEHRGFCESELFNQPLRNVGNKVDSLVMKQRNGKWEMYLYFANFIARLTVRLVHFMQML